MQTLLFLHHLLQFLSTPSARRATCRLCFFCIIFCNFYPRPPRGGRRSSMCSSTAGRRFLSTPSARRATHIKGGAGGVLLFLSTPSARRATDNFALCSGLFFISIHALREEGDSSSSSSLFKSAKFLSTPSARRATIRKCRQNKKKGISIHALREEGDVKFVKMSHNALLISIHALREEGDQPAGLQHGLHIQFLSTPSARRATCCPLHWASIPGNFYPRPPRGGRPTLQPLM